MIHFLLKWKGYQSKPNVSQNRFSDITPSGSVGPRCVFPSFFPSVMVIRPIIDNKKTFLFWSLSFMFFIKSITPPQALIPHPKEKWQNKFRVWWMTVPFCGSCNRADDKELSGLPIRKLIVIWISVLFEMVTWLHWIGNLTWLKWVTEKLGAIRGQWDDMLISELESVTFNMSRL